VQVGPDQVSVSKSVRRSKVQNTYEGVGERHGPGQAQLFADVEHGFDAAFLSARVFVQMWIRQNGVATAAVRSERVESMLRLDRFHV
jgi:hypothetical protein